jgi:ABC-type methionine transport system ATPase subunit
MLSISRVGGAFWTSPLTLRMAPGEVWGVIGANQTGKSTFLRLLAARMPVNTGASLWLSVAPDAMRPHIREQFSAHRSPDKWNQQVVLIPDKPTWMEKWRYGNVEKMLETAAQKRPAVLLVDDALRFLQPAQTPAFQALLTDRRQQRGITVLAAAELSLLPFVDKVLLLRHQQPPVVMTTKALLDYFRNPVMAIQVRDMQQLEQDMTRMEGIRGFYRQDNHLRLQLNDFDGAANAANAGMAVMRLSAWLAIHDHQDISVQPVTPTLQDYIKMC